MRDTLLRVQLNKSKVRRIKKKSASLRTVRISKDKWIYPHGKVMDFSKPITRSGIIFRDGEYAIRKVYVGDVDFYNISKNGEDILSWRESIGEAERDLVRYKTGKLVMNEQGADVDKLLKSKTNIWGQDIDKPIRPVIKELNDNGFSTSWSCAGHNDYGFIKFRDKYSDEDKDEVRQILKKNGIAILDFGEDDGGHTEVIIKEVK